MQVIEFSSAISQLDQQINDAKAYLKKLRQYKKLLSKIEQEQAPQPVTPVVPAPAVDSLPPVAAPEPVAPTVEPIAEADPWAQPLDITPAPAPIIPAPAPTLYLLPPAKSPDYAVLGIRELRKIAKSKQVSNASRMAKSDLVAALQAA